MRDELRDYFNRELRITRTIAIVLFVTLVGIVIASAILTNIPIMVAVSIPLTLLGTFFALKLVAQWEYLDKRQKAVYIVLTTVVILVVVSFLVYTGIDLYQLEKEFRETTIFD